MYICYSPQCSCGKVMFHKCVSRILSMGRCLPQCMLGYTPPGPTPPLDSHSPLGRHTPPPKYASTWNAFLFRFCLRLRLTTDIYESCVCDFVWSGYFSCYLGCELQYLTRMHSSRMHTICCSGRRGEGMYPSMHWVGGGVSQYALGRGCVYSSMH